MLCNRCHCEVRETDAFCEHCGNPIAANVQNENENAKANATPNSVQNDTWNSSFGQIFRSPFEEKVSSSKFELFMHSFIRTSHFKKCLLFSIICALFYVVLFFISYDTVFLNLYDLPIVELPTFSLSLYLTLYGFFLSLSIAFSLRSFFSKSFTYILCNGTIGSFLSGFFIQFVYSGLLDSPEKKDLHFSSSFLLNKESYFTETASSNFIFCIFLYGSVIYIIALSLYYKLQDKEYYRAINFSFLFGIVVSALLFIADEFASDSLVVLIVVFFLIFFIQTMFIDIVLIYHNKSLQEKIGISLTNKEEQ